MPDIATRNRLFEAGKASLRGERSINQDRCLFLSNPESTLLCVADGLGGHPRGEVAAQLLMDVAETQFRHSVKPLANPDRFIVRCIDLAHEAILRFGRRYAPPISPRTTAVIAVIQNGIAHWAHIGDSRLYLIRNGDAVVQTRDHSQVRFVRLTPDAPSRPRASLTRCVGGYRHRPEVTPGAPTALHTGDVLLLCTDGLWNQIPRHMLLEAWDDSDIEARLTALADLAARTPNSDNVSAIALRWLGDRASDGQDTGTANAKDSAAQAGGTA